MLVIPRRKARADQLRPVGFSPLAFVFLCLIVVSYAVASGGLAGGLSVPLVLALCTATWVWTLPETRGIVLS